MARRKNTKRIDPRYFLHETAYRDLEEGINDQQAVQQLAKTFSKDPVIMAAVKEATKDPKILQAIQRAAEEDPSPEMKEDKRSKAEQFFDSPYPGVGAIAGLTTSIQMPTIARWAQENAMLPDFMNLIASATSIDALGITGGITLAAITLLFSHELDRLDR